MEDARQVDEGDGRHIRVVDLDAQDIFGELLAAAAPDAHGFLGFLDEVGEHLPVEGGPPEGRARGIAFMVRKLDADDGPRPAAGRRAEDELGGEARAYVPVDGESYARDGLENGALA